MVRPPVMHQCQTRPTMDGPVTFYTLYAMRLMSRVQIYQEGGGTSSIGTKRQIARMPSRWEYRAIQMCI